MVIFKSCWIYFNFLLIICRIFWQKRKSKGLFFEVPFQSLGSQYSWTSIQCMYPMKCMYPSKKSTSMLLTNAPIVLWFFCAQFRKSDDSPRDFSNATRRYSSILDLSLATIHQKPNGGNKRTTHLTGRPNKFWFSKNPFSKDVILKH